MTAADTARSDVRSYVDAICYKFRVESGAVCASHGDVTEVRYPGPLLQTWPRKLRYRREFIGDGVDGSPPAALADAIAAALAHDQEAHLVDVFHPDPPEVLCEFDRRGYAHAWTRHLLGRPLTAADAEVEPVPGLTCAPVIGRRDRIAYDALYPTDEPRSADPHLFSYLVRRDGRAAAKGQVVVRPGHAAYVSAMYTAPEHRRQGCCSMLMRHLHAVAARQGAKRVILIPSQMADAMELYPRYGYRPGVPMVVLVPREGR